MVDIAYGGNFYAIVEPQQNYPRLDDFSAGEILRLSPMLRRALNETVRLRPSREPDHPRRLATSCGPASRATPRRMPATPCSTATRRSTASPCGTGTSARMAQLAAKGKLKVGDDFVHESIIGSAVRGPGRGRDRGRRAAGDHPLDRRLGADDRAQHHLRRRPRPLRPRLRRHVSAGRLIVGGNASGPVIASAEGLSFWGGVDPGHRQGDRPAPSAVRHHADRAACWLCRPAADPARAAACCWILR